MSYLLHSDNQLNHATKTKNVSILRAPRNHLYSNTVCLMVSFRRGSLSGVGPKGTGTQPTKCATFAQVLFRAEGDLRISGFRESSPPSLLPPKSATDVSLCAGVRCTPGRGWPCRWRRSRHRGEAAGQTLLWQPRRPLRPVCSRPRPRSVWSLKPKRSPWC